MADYLDAARGLVDFIDASPSMFHTTATIRRELDEAGFTYLPETAAWNVCPGGSYYTVRNGSTVIAWVVGSEVGAAVRGVDDAALPYHFQIAAAHGDSPTFKVKSVPELAGPGEYLRLNVEAYGGMIDYTWLDRPLGLAGRVLVREEGGEEDRAGGRVESRLVAINRPVALIPSLAIHMNREVNKGFAPNRQVDLCPLFSAGALKAGAFNALVAAELGVQPKQVIAHDLFLVSLERPTLWGARADAPEFVSAPKLDDLMCAYTALRAFLASGNSHDISVYCCFDNEEVGSNTKQGAMSTVLADVLSRVNASLGFEPEALQRALAASMLVSCDNAHAVHPNHPEFADEGSRPVLNGGLAVKEAANQHYCTDAFSRAAVCAVFDAAGVPHQPFANRSDMAGGSTLGNLSNMQVSIHAVDVGCPQLAMHSSYETAGARDAQLAIDALTAFYNADLRIENSDAFQV